MTIIIVAYCVIIINFVLIEKLCLPLCSCYFSYGRLEVVKYLVNNPTVTVKPEGDLTPLEVAQQ